MNRILTLCWTTLISCSVVGQTHTAGVPSTPKHRTSDEYHGFTVTEDYRWLENINDPAVKEWVQQQNAYSRAYLDALPSHRHVAERLRQLMLDRSTVYGDLSESGGKIFALKDDPRRNQRSLISLRSVDDLTSEHMIVDPDVMNPKGTTAIDWFVPSGDGKLVAVSLSEDGSENGTVYVFNTEDGSKRPDVITNVQHPTASGSLAWDKGSTGFYYTRYPTESERPKADLHFYQEVYYHKLGTPATGDTYVIGKEFPRIAEIKLESGDDALLVSVANGDGGEFAHWLLFDGKWSQITAFHDGIESATMSKGYLFCLSRKDAPHGEILKIPLVDPRLSAAKLIVPTGDPVIKELCLAGDRLFVTDLLGGPERIRVFDVEGHEKGMISSNEPASLGGIVPLNPDSVLYSKETYTVPLAFYCYNVATGASTRTGLGAAPPGDAKDIEVIREVSESKDGTKVPLYILRKKGTVLDGRNPTLLYGYGGFTISLSPSARYWLPLWIEQGGVYVEAILRGGGEFGEEWHKGGNRSRKQNVFDDFAACAQWLIDHKYTEPSRLAIFGASNGGLLMGAELTQHPGLFRAVVSRVGIYDMLRSELSPNGVFNVTEYGTVKDSAECKALLAYSPYHHVKDGTRYPAILMATGDRDGRVDPMQSRKMIARLQAASSSGYPVMLRTTAHAGHGIGTSREEFLSEQTDIFTFLISQLGMAPKPQTP